MTNDERLKDEIEARLRFKQGVAEKQFDVPDLSDANPENLRELIHELRVHQIELQMQNEELRKTLLVLESARDKYEEWYDRAPVGYFTLDKKGTILEANFTACDLLCVKRGLLIGKPLASFVNEEGGNILYLHFRRVLETQSKQTCDVQIIKKDGSQVYISLESELVRGELRLGQGISDCCSRCNRAQESGGVFAGERREA